MLSVEEFLRGTPLLRDLPRCDLASFATSEHTQIYAQGPLPQPEHPSGVISFVERGSVRLYRVTAKGRQLTVGVREAGDYFLHISTGALDVPRSWVEALADGTVVHRFPRPRFDLLVARHPALALALIDDLSRHLGDAYDRLEDAALRPADIQLAHTLARLGGDDHPVITDSQEAIAARMGSPRERVTKGLGRLQTAGLVLCRPHTHQIILLKPRRLREL